MVFFALFVALVVWLVVIGTSVWVFFDARALGARRGLINGLGDMGPFGWALCSLLLWIVAFPLYLAKRSKIRAAVLAESPHLRTKTCPFCAETIRETAIKCKYCGSDLSHMPKPKSAPRGPLYIDPADRL